MEEGQRNYITKNLYELIQNTKVDCSLIAKLRQIDALSEEEATELTTENRPFEKTSLLYNYLQKRNVYDQLITILDSINQSGAVEILKRRTHCKPQPHSAETDGNPNKPCEVIESAISTVLKNIFNEDIVTYVMTRIKDRLSDAVATVCKTQRHLAETEVERKLRLMEDVLAFEVAEHRTFLECEAAICAAEDYRKVVTRHKEKLSISLSLIPTKLDFPVSHLLLEHFTNRFEEKCSLELFYIMQTHFYSKKSHKLDHTLVSQCSAFIANVCKGINQEVSQKYPVARNYSELESTGMGANSKDKETLSRLISTVINNLCKNQPCKIFTKLKSSLRKLISATNSFHEYSRWKTIDEIRSAYLALNNGDKFRAKIAYEKEFETHRRNSRKFKMVNSLDQKAHVDAVSVAVNTCRNLGTTEKLFLEWYLDKQFQPATHTSAGPSLPNHISHITQTEAIIIGIDLGTQFIRVVAYYDDKPHPIIESSSGEVEIPNRIQFIPNRGATVGEANRPILKQYAVFDLKQMLGKPLTDEALSLHSKFWPFTLTTDLNQKPQIVVGSEIHCVENLIALILKHVKQKVELVFSSSTKMMSVVMSVPSHYTTVQKCSLFHALKLANLNVIKFVDESLAAWYSLRQAQVANGTHVIFDFGAGELSVSVVAFNSSRNHAYILASSGEDNLGGINIDQNMAKFCITEFQKVENLDSNSIMEMELFESERGRLKLHQLLFECEKCKIELSSAPTAEVCVRSFWNNIDLQVEFSRELFNKVNGNIFERAMEILHTTIRASGQKLQDIRSVILVGGSTQIVKMQELLGSAVGSSKLKFEIQTKKNAIAEGAAAYIYKNLRK